MEKFTFYELLSFIIPGFVILLLIKVYALFVFNIEIIALEKNSIIEVLLFLSGALFIGLIIQLLTFKLLKFKCLKRYKNEVFRDVDSITKKTPHISQLVPYLKEKYIQYNQHHNNRKNTTVEVDNIFDLAYYYLETNGKISASKNFQSLYFCFRNILTINGILFLCSLILLLLPLFFQLDFFSLKNAILFSLLNLIIPLILIKPTQWLREKMIIKLLWSYYSELIYKEKNNANQ